MLDLHSIVGGAEQIHQTFETIFYSLVTILLILGVILEYFKFPLGGVPGFGLLVGRALVAVLLLCIYPEVSNLLADISDAFSTQLGDLNSFKLVLSKMGDQLLHFSASWLSVKDTILVAITFLTFFLLYAAVYFVEAMTLYAWVLLYIFSPLLIALYVLPSTAQATKSLFRSLVEVSLWKIVFSVMATLLWTSAASDINQDANLSFVTVIIYNLFLAASLLLTPVLVSALAGAGISGVAGSLGTTALNAAVAAPGQILGAVALPKVAAAFAAKKLGAGLKAGFDKITAGSKEASGKSELQSSKSTTKKEAYQHRRAEEARKTEKPAATQPKTPPPSKPKKTRNHPL
jgi:hypothetical protein